MASPETRQTSHFLILLNEDFGLAGDFPRRNLDLDFALGRAFLRLAGVVRVRSARFVDLDSPQATASVGKTHSATEYRNDRFGMYDGRAVCADLRSGSCAAGLVVPGADSERFAR